MIFRPYNFACAFFRNHHVYAENTKHRKPKLAKTFTLYAVTTVTSQSQRRRSPQRGNSATKDVLYQPYVHYWLLTGSRTVTYELAPMWLSYDDLGQWRRPQIAHNVPTLESSSIRKYVFASSMVATTDCGRNTVKWRSVKINSLPIIRSVRIHTRMHL